MASSIELLKVDLAHQLEHLVALRLPAEEQDMALAFLRALYENLPPADLVSERADYLLTSALSLLDFCRERALGQAKVRVRRDPNQATRTLVELITDDMPFLVDSVRGCLQQVGLDVRLLIHPVVVSERDGERLLRLASARTGGPLPPARPVRQESVMQVWVRHFPEALHAGVQAQLLQVLADVRAAYEDFAPMRESALAQSAACRARAAQSSPGTQELLLGPSLTEAAELLEWLTEEHFVFLGYSAAQVVSAHAPDHATGAGRRFDRTPGLGLLRDPKRSMFDIWAAPPREERLRILKANRRSTVHRTAHLDSVLLLDDSAEGGLQVHLWVGLFTSSSYACPVNSIPIVGPKMHAVLARARFAPMSHDDRLLRFVLETYPRDELFQISIEDLHSIAMGIFHLQNRPRVALFVRRDPLARFVACLVYIPRDRMDTSLRLAVQTLLAEAFNGELVSYLPELGEAPLGRLYLVLRTPHGIAAVDHGALERRVEQLARTWQERLEFALPTEFGEERGLALARAHATTFPASYRDVFDEGAATFDVASIEEALQRGLALQLYRELGCPAHTLQLKLFTTSGQVPLSSVIPMLENLGLRAEKEVPFVLRPPHAQTPVWLHVFTLVMEDQVSVDVDQVRAQFIEAFEQIFRGEIDSDGFNKLILHAGLSAREVLLLRSVGRYLRLIQSPFSLAYMQQTLRQNRTIAAGLVDYFHKRFDPTERDERRAARSRAQLVSSLDALSSLDQDRILRLFLQIITAAVRTNYYQAGEGGGPKAHLALKLDCSLIPTLPRPRPFREVFVSGPLTEGVHLRFGKVARGGLRWSDRLEDFRTEVLGLVKAQQVKNAVIVPVGSKGGFVVRRPTASTPAAARAEAIACYEHFVGGLLDVTDNIAIDGNGRDSLVPPDKTRVHDEPDPYLVVAADKGTATFSDIANALSQRRGFWLGDAFASGGSAGYDHKAMGITARGAWECVERHFRELGRDIQNKPFTVAGIGDMSGDVFGNGMLLSPQICLVAAFDHRHIFVDPTPDPRVSLAERKRLFALERSSWADYDPALISAGGGVFPRSLKEIPLSKEIRSRLGLGATSLTPAELIQAILRAEVDLLYFGGIGTYIKASSETHTQVGDHGNDAVRIDGKEVRAKVIAEGANLGLTQLGRVEYSLAGGRCNTDFIDNSGGVDCSDHEVNLKILLSDCERRLGLTRSDRNELLRQMTDELAGLVLRDNALQSLCVSVSERLGVERTLAVQRYLGREQGLDPALEFLPDEESLRERQGQGLGYTRPELCVLLAYTKNNLSAELQRSPLLDDPLLQEDLTHYFPGPIVARYRENIGRHRLRRELTATQLCNELVNRMGIAYLFETRRSSGRGPAEIALAYRYARELTGTAELWGLIEGLDGQVPAHAQHDLLLECARLIEQVAAALLRAHPAARFAEVRPHYERACRAIEALSRSEQQGRAATGRDLAERWTRAGVPAPLAERVARRRLLTAAIDLADLAAQTEAPLERALLAHTLTGERFGCDWLKAACDGLPQDRAWDRQAQGALRDDVLVAQQSLARSLLMTTRDARAEPGQPETELQESAVQTWLGTRRTAFERLQQLLTELRAAPAVDLAMLLLPIRQLQALSS